MASRALVLIVLAFVFMSAQTDPFSISKRFELFGNSLEVIKTHPWGTGLGHYLVAQGSMGSKYLMLSFQPVHNVFLYIFAEIGIILSGILLFLGGKQILKRMHSLAFALCFVVVLGTGMGDHYWITLQQNLLLLPVIFGLLES